MITSETLKKLFESLYLQYYQLVLQMCLGYMKGDDDLAKDLAQEVFINVWNALAGFRGEASHKTWIYRITVNTCLLYIRRNSKELTSPLEETYQFEDIEKTENERDKHYALYEAIGKLSQLERLIMMLVLEELDYGQISKITGISAINLRVKIHRIKKKMKQLLNFELTNG